MQPTEFEAIKKKVSSCRGQLILWVEEDTGARSGDVSTKLHMCTIEPDGETKEVDELAKLPLCKDRLVKTSRSSANAPFDSLGLSPDQNFFYRRNYGQIQLLQIGATADRTPRVLIGDEEVLRWFANDRRSNVGSNPFATLRKMMKLVGCERLLPLTFSPAQYNDSDFGSMRWSELLADLSGSQIEMEGIKERYRHVFARRDALIRRALEELELHQLFSALSPKHEALYADLQTGYKI